MQKNYKNRAIKTGEEKEREPKEQKGEAFFYPEQGRVIIATSKAEADKKIKKIITK